jgi:hypothetical protein
VASVLSGTDLVYFTVVAMENEADPRCLLVALQCVEVGNCGFLMVSGFLSRKGVELGVCGGGEEGGQGGEGREGRAGGQKRGEGGRGAEGRGEEGGREGGRSAPMQHFLGGGG